MYMKMPNSKVLLLLWILVNIHTKNSFLWKLQELLSDKEEFCLICSIIFTGTERKVSMEVVQAVHINSKCKCVKEGLCTQHIV